MEQSEAMSLARSWWTAVSDTSFVPLPSGVGHGVLSRHVDELWKSLSADVFDPSAGTAIGAALVELRMTNPSVIEQCANILSTLSNELTTRGEIADAHSRSIALLGSLATGYAAALQRKTLHDQEAIQRAMATARTHARDAFHASDTRFRVVFDNAPVAIFMGDTAGTVLDANPAAHAMFDGVEDLRGTNVTTLLHPRHREEIRRRIFGDLVRSRFGTESVEIGFRRSNRADGWAQFTVTFVPGVGNQDDYLLAVGEDVTERRAMQAALQHQARHDPLTGLPNRLLLHETLHEIGSVATEHDRVGLCFVDLDGFKAVNDRFGHGTGDRLLAAVAARLHRAATAADHLVARVGGDEFVAVIRPPATDSSIVDAAHGLLDTLTAPFRIDGHEVSISASLGVVVSALNGVDPEILLDTADTALYRAKSDGGGTLIVHNPTAEGQHQ